MIKEKIEKKNQRKFLDKRTTVCYLIGFSIAFFQNLFSTTGTPLFVFFESLGFAIGVGLIYMIPLWFICKIWDSILSFKKSLKN